MHSCHSSPTRRGEPEKPERLVGDYTMKIINNMLYNMKLTKYTSYERKLEMNLNFISTLLGPLGPAHLASPFFLTLIPAAAHTTPSLSLSRLLCAATELLASPSPCCHRSRRLLLPFLCRQLPSPSWRRRLLRRPPSFPSLPMPSPEWPDAAGSGDVQ